ncbi:uncharacterized protein LOC123410132 [Hordeum vulgare subsp. vulgare]|uniref:AIPP2-like SPOC-like domain-containing protein n=1 Tax=Hordeum vulgare subsp. vulgare TaxID=112509 RepID=A0A8I6YQ79_HORVV|nr:uncharacterized protein LOC123410132 [Hordeum vulgare subsp. vulgare]
MVSRRQHSVNHFGPSLRKSPMRKGPGKLKKKCLDQFKRTQQSFRVGMEHRFNHANERADDNVAKRPQQNKIARKTPFEEPSHAKAVSRPNISSSWPNKGTVSSRENVEKSKPYFSRTLQKNTLKASPSRAMPNSGIDSLQKNTTKSRPSSFILNGGNTLRPNNGMGSLAKNVESCSRLNNFDAPRSKNTKMPGSTYSRPNDEMASRSMKSRPFSFGSSCGFDPLMRNLEKSNPFLTRGPYSSVLKDCSNSTFGSSKKSYPSSMVGNLRKEGHHMAMEALNSNLALKGKQGVQDIQPNVEINCVSLPGKNLPSHETVEASCMVDSINGGIRLDSRKCMTSLSEDGSTDVYNSKSKRMKPLLEEKVGALGVTRLTKSMGISLKLNKNTSIGEDERMVGDKFNKRKSENCSQTNKRRIYVVSDNEDDDDGDQNLTGAKSGDAGLKTQKDCHLEVSNLFGAESLKPPHYCSLPIDEPVWSGIIKIGSGKLVSLAAHLSTKYCEKVWKLSRSLEPVVEVTKLSRFEAWPRSFETSRPTDDNIALYLLPTKMRQDAYLDQLVKEVMENDMVLRAIVGEAEMLIFPSILLPEQHQTFQGNPYLWAVFRRRKDQVPLVEEEQHGKGRCPQEKGKQQASHFSVGEGSNMDAGLEASEEVEIEDMEQEQNPTTASPATSPTASPNAPSPTTSAPTMAAAKMSASHGQDHSNMAAPTGALFGFVIQRTPRLEQLIQEMQREGAVMVAMQGQMIGPGLGLGRQ